jgi:hypothetical protein
MMTSNDVADDSGVIYVVGEIGLATPVKIGMAKSQRHAHRRMLSFGTGNPRPLEMTVVEVAHCRWIEFQLHHVLKPFWAGNRNSTEWFDVRSHMTTSWSDFIVDALAGRIPGAGPLPLSRETAGHRLLHVHGVPRHMRSVCSCTWRSSEGSALKALAKFDAHVDNFTDTSTTS